ncbi:DUF3375 domain-containing protein [Desulfosarcina ovata]|uniref:DUF3375 domain-containing protein n=1 Tax=Desulfosarcina ovata subsp. ovata TaxID=2752305 RepID=A0A5K8A3F2_9BACT|nr:DUF3375 domain-containing protein [Desulfosarcina ovata]BBO87103.1 hypothetical protein DSCOOX_02830 [Desulfosarcina ovata subsp. ovata]
MEYEYIVGLKKHPAWRLLNADSAPLIISFFHRVFTRENRRTVPSEEMTARLEDTLFHLRRVLGESAYPRSAKAYLDEWSSGEAGYLRKFYPARGEEEVYDLTPASEKVIAWLSTFAPTQFVGTESRLLTIFRLLREMVKEAMVDPEAEIRRLEAEKSRIETELADLKAGHFAPSDRTRIRERFLEARETAHRLLFDFRQIEENFRHLDRQTREKIAVSDASKGQLLDDIFGEQDAINGSDQGKSFRAFWQYIMSPVSQEELETLLTQVLALPEIEDLDEGDRLGRIRFQLIDAGERVNQTCAQLVEQLRKYLDDQAWLENRRIMEIIRKIEKKAVQVRETVPPESDFAHLTHVKPDIGLPMARGLFQPSARITVDDRVEMGSGHMETDILYRQQVVDEKILRQRIRSMLKGHSQTTLARICEQYPVEKGMSEILAYLHLACKDDNAMVNSDVSVPIFYRDQNGRTLKAIMPEVIFVR